MSKYRHLLELIFDASSGSNNHDHPSLHENWNPTANSCILAFQIVTKNVLTFGPQLQMALWREITKWWHLNNPNSGMNQKEKVRY